MSGIQVEQGLEYEDVSSGNGLDPRTLVRGPGGRSAGEGARHDALIDTDCIISNCTIDRTKTGAAIGGLFGYNFQRGSFVYGLEGDWNWVGAKIDSFHLEGPETSNDVRWLATIRGRAGLAVDAT